MSDMMFNRALNQRDILRHALENVEWTPVLGDTDGTRYCPACGNTEARGHMDQCVTNHALAWTHQSTPRKVPT